MFALRPPPGPAVFQRAIAPALMALVFPLAHSQETIRRALPAHPAPGETRYLPPSPPMAAATADDIACILAGMNPASGGMAEAVTRSPETQRHQAALSSLWADWERQRLRAMRDWAISEIRPMIRRPQTVYYLFSGPDFISVAALFPGANHYVMVGLEPVGSLPDITRMAPGNRQSVYDQLVRMVGGVAGKGFFETKAMRQDFQQGGSFGCAPVVAVFLVRTGHRILGVERVTLDRQGGIVPAGGAARGVRMTFQRRFPHAGSPSVQTLAYFSTDISDGAWRKDSSFAAYLRSCGRGGGFLKAASYLMHGSGFTMARSFLLENCDFILQDESGMPFRFFDAARWDVRLFGSYVGPVELFRQHYQPDLAAAHARAPGRQLPFGIGYRVNDPDSNLVFARRRTGWAGR